MTPSDVPTQPANTNTLDRQPRTIRRLALVIALPIVGVALAWWLLSPTGPSERNRVVHPAGYSVIKPSDWRQKTITRPSPSGGPRDSLAFDPERWIGLAPEMWVRRFNGEPDFDRLKRDGFVDGTFQGAPALVLQHHPKNYMTVWRTVTRQNGDWYELGASLPGLEGTEPEKWWRYLETFRPAPAAPSTTTRSTTASPAATGPG